MPSLNYYCTSPRRACPKGGGRGKILRIRREGGREGGRQGTYLIAGRELGARVEGDTRNGGIGVRALSGKLGREGGRKGVR